jgi:transposase
MYSLDFRKKVFEIKEKENLTFEETSKRFYVGTKTLFRWQQRIEPITKRNVSSRKIDIEKLKKDVEENPDLYQFERAEKFKVAQSTIFYALKRLGFTYKKNVLSSKSK